MEDERMLTVEEAARRLGAHAQTIRSWLRTGKLKGHMPGGTKLGYRIPAREVERLLRGEPRAAADGPAGAGGEG
jgi:excisionase family DNA binding protein